MNPAVASAARGSVFTRLFPKRNATVRAQKRNTKSLPSFYEAMGSRAYMVAPGQPVWMGREFSRFADEAYIRNVIAHRAIRLVAEGAASVRWKLFLRNMRGQRELTQHPLLSLIMRPTPFTSYGDFFESVYHYHQISGNVFLLAVGPANEPPRELHVLRPDRVAIIAGQNGMPAGYRYTVGDTVTNYPADRLTGRSRILHIKTFHPLNDWYGLSPVEAAAYSIDQHNMSASWNQAMLQNGARPSGALIVRASDQGTGHLSEDQYYRIKKQIDEQFSGPVNAGRPLLLEGGLDWKEMSLSPRDMDFVQTKNSAARDIALAFGVPPQMLGIPGDNTYSNLQEARLALWEQSILPLVQSVADAFAAWLAPMFGGDLYFVPDVERISALALRNQIVWDRVEKATFLTTDEKRAAVGYGPMGTVKSRHD